MEFIVLINQEATFPAVYISRVQFSLMQQLSLMQQISLMQQLSLAQQISLM